MNAMERAVAEWDCLKLCNTWFHLLDQNRLEAYIDLFTPDAVFVKGGQTIRGREAIRQSYLDLPPGKVLRIVLSFAPYETAPARVKARFSLMAVSHADTPNPMTSLLAVDDDYRLTADGWRIAARVSDPVVMSLTGPGQLRLREG